jgi:hypothetical protein
MEKPAVSPAKGRKGGSWGMRIVLVLVGFVAVAICVQLRRVYGYNEQRTIGTMNQRREALISEQLKLQDAIRVASDRKHIIDIATSRLNMRVPDLNQVIDLPRRPLPRGRDSVRP